MSTLILTLERLRIAMRYYAKARTRYKLHSPFLSRLVAEVFYGKTEDEVSRRLLAYRASLNACSANCLSASQYSLGHRQAGLSVARFSQRASSPTEQCERLYRLVKWLKPHFILELGTGCGMATYALSMGPNQASLITVEGNRELAKFASNQFETLGLNRVRVVNAEFDEFLADTPLHPWNLVFLDGNHQLEPTLRYARNLLEQSADNLCLVLDDIHHSPQMYLAWEQLTKEQSIRCSLETPRLGFLFANQALTPGHFTWVPLAWKPWQIGLFG
ncbi:MAG: class I SAM-dependent methyltransferase [Saprospiraceae bacterium]|nr:class I SAM-dependent methyltransferase [Saprospiraceae bacterium]MBV6472867.1 hypothetical protein [Saprospiraceae bacterium]